LAKRLRKDPSPPEARLWARLRGCKPAFRRQHPIGPYVLDFYCTAHRLAVEVDGFAHDTEDRPERDELRDEWLAAQGVTTIRIAASDVLKDPDSVADGLIRLVQEAPPQSLRASSPARGGAQGKNDALGLPCEAGEGDQAQPGGGGAAPLGNYPHG
jgi:very-short-patch-repair endonuclease